MFMFMKQAMNDAKPSNSGAGGIKDFGTQLEQPVTLSGPGYDSTGAPVTFYATLRMEPFQAPSGIRYSAESQTRGAAPVTQVRRPQGYLKTLRQNPYFSAELLRPRASPETRGGYSRSYEPEARDLAVEKIVARERAKEEVYIEKLKMKEDAGKQNKYSAGLTGEAEYDYKRKYDRPLRDRFDDDYEYQRPDRDRITEEYDYRRKEDEVKRKSKYSEQDDDEVSAVPDDNEAADDVNDLVASVSICLIVHKGLS